MAIENEVMDAKAYSSLDDNVPTSDSVATSLPEIVKNAIANEEGG